MVSAPYCPLWRARAWAEGWTQLLLWELLDLGLQPLQDLTSSIWGREVLCRGAAEVGMITALVRAGVKSWGDSKDSPAWGSCPAPQRLCRVRGPVLGWAWGQGTSEARHCRMWRVPLTSLCDRQAGLAWLLAGGSPKEKPGALPLGSAPATGQRDSCPACFEGMIGGFQASPGRGLDAGNPRLVEGGARHIGIAGG